MKGKTFYLRRLFLTLQEWQHCKEDPILSQELFIKKLYNARVHFNLGREICIGQLIFLISVRSDKADLEQFGTFGKKSQCSYREAGGNALSTTTTTTASSMTSVAISLKIGHFSNTLCNNRQSANAHAPVPSSLPKPISGNKILFGKINECAPCMMPKAAFVEEVDDDDTNFELASRVSVFSATDNQIQKSVMGCNIARPPGG